uniref:Lysosomal Pro-X carboxypeptidase n=1 Tax=Dermatophagoides pteronyssinus TaxID=6956 RepID=A0A6P6Y6Z5_DERPT|nr:lysosomal Pro-X carboxypeptidase-like [Dermatophagoides pteronyssinus]
MKISLVILINLSIFFILIDGLKIQNHHHQHHLSLAQPLSLKYSNFQVKYFQQKVDHFSYSNNDTFEQRYIISTEHWKSPNGPIWFYAGNEGDIFTFANNTGFMWDNAKKFNAMIIFMEHRYYGESMPYGKKSMQNLSMAGYLTVEQALADYADFIVDIHMTINGARSSPVVIMGGSYGGMLAAWFRIKYPHLCVGALAASAPILQFPDIYDCEGYNRIATKDFTNYSPKCSESIRRSWSAIRRLAKTNDGRKFLSEQFQLCEEFPEQQVQTLIDWIANIWGTLPMIDYPNPADFLSKLPAYPIKVVCQYLTEPDSNDKQLIQSIAKAISVYTNYTGDTECNKINESNDRLGTNAWDFQACTEMVLPECSNGVDDMFEPEKWTFDEFSAGCRQKYGINSDRYKALIMFGGKHISHTATNIIFSNGLRDPWSAGGVLETLSDTLIAIKIPGACHHEDLRSQGPNDPKILLEAREQELQIIGDWLQSYYEQNQIEFKF